MRWYKIIWDLLGRRKSWTHVKMWCLAWFGIEDCLLARLQMDSQLESYGWWRKCHWQGGLSPAWAWWWNYYYWEPLEWACKILQVFVLHGIGHWAWTFLVNQNQDLLVPLLKQRLKDGNCPSPPKNLVMPPFTVVCAGSGTRSATVQWDGQQGCQSRAGSNSSGAKVVWCTRFTVAWHHWGWC